MDKNYICMKTSNHTPKIKAENIFASCVSSLVAEACE